VFDEVGSYIERNRKNWGFVILAVACIHFVVPGCVLL
jgi:hypothetical protein